MPSEAANPNGVCPYTMPKFTAFALRRMSEVTISGGTRKTSAAVRV